MLFTPPPTPQLLRQATTNDCPVQAVGARLRESWPAFAKQWGLRFSLERKGVWGAIFTTYLPLGLLIQN